MAISNGLRTALNMIRETSIEDNTLYHRYVPEILPTTDIGSFASPLLDNPDLMNEFMNVLVKRIAYTKIENKLFRNKLRVLEGEEIPLGAIGQEIFINPAKGRQFNVDDFAGLLAKYESDVKVQYHQLNSDLQYPATITRAKIKDAFVSWSSLEDFVNGITQSLYNGAYIDDYKYTKKLITNAYNTNAVVMETFSFANASAPTDDELKALTAKLREIYLNFKVPSTKYNAWKKVGGYGRSIVSWSKPEDIVVFVSNKMASILDVNVLANAFNMDKTSLMGRVYNVEDFDVYNDEGTKVIDGSNIYALICDRRWFKIREKDMFMDEFYNASNRSWQQFLNVIKSYNFSLFANAVMLVGALPTYHITSASFNETTPEVTAGEKITLTLTTVPFNATDTVTFTSGTVGKATVEKIDDRTVEVTGVASGTSVITATNGTVSGTVTVTVTSA